MSLLPDHRAAVADAYDADLDEVTGRSLTQDALRRFRRNRAHCDDGRVLTVQKIMMFSQARASGKVEQDVPWRTHAHCPN